MQQQLKITKIFIIVAVVILLAGCQEEYTKISEPDSNTSFMVGDTIADLIRRVTLKDGSFDNVVDNCNEISLKYPYSIQVRNEIVTITSEEDLENLKQVYPQLKNSIKIDYPVTVIFSDYSESVLSNPGELQKIQNQYNPKKEDDDIECIDFVYPLDLSLYNKAYQKPDFLSAGNDKELHGVLKNMNDIIVEIGYPVMVKIKGGTKLNINNNKELQNEILKVAGTCDEADETEFGTGENLNPG